MYRAYQPITPANNLFLKNIWDKDIYRYHRRRVQAAKAVIDNTPPKTYMHLHIKPKKLQMEGERLAILEKDNRILLEKMAHIMRTGGRVDNVKHDYCKKSLNKTKRYRELLRITYENLAILKRINAKESHYNHNKYALDWQFNRKYIRNISKYPNNNKTTHSAGDFRSKAPLPPCPKTGSSCSSYLASQLPKDEKIKGAERPQDKSSKQSEKKVDLEKDTQKSEQSEE